MENTLNPQALALTKAIKQHESGGKYDIKGKSEEYGAYQWTPDTWKSHAKAVLGDENADITNPTLQNKVAYSVIEKDLKSGLSPAEVSAKWNSGQPKGWENKRGVNKFGVKYDVPAYVNSVGQLYTQEYQKAKQPVVQESQVQPQSEFNPLFASNPNDSLLETGAKTLGNVIPSAFNFAKNTLSAINPINTIKNIGQIGSEFQALSQEQGGAGQALSQTAQALPQSLYEGLVPTAGRELIKAGYQGVTGQDTTQSLQNAQQAITEDPFGQIAPFVLGARQLAEKAGYVKQFDDFIKRGVDATLKPVTAPAKFIGEKAGQVARGTVAQATGLNPETVKALIDNPELYTKTARQNLNRSAIATKVGTALDDLESQVSDTGTGYNAIRENTGVTYVAPTFLNEALKPFNIKVQNGKIITSAESTPLSTADITQLQKFVDDFGNERFLTNNAFLNARTALSDMSKYDAQKTGRLQSVSRTLREAYDAIGKEKIDGLKNLDEEFAPIKKQFELLKKDYLKKEDGEYVFKDGAVTKLANLDKVGRERILGRLEELVPDISKDIKMLKVVEDIERASGIKVGTYGKGALLGAGLLSGGVVGAIISAILTSPEIAVPLIRGYGLSKNQTAQVLMNLRLMLGETKQSGMDLLQKEIPVEDMVNALTGKGLPNRQGGFIKNPLASTVDNNKYLYHGTSQSAFERIQQEGIKPQRRGVSSLSKSEDYSKNWAFPPTNTKGVMLRVKNDFMTGKTVKNNTKVATDKLNEVLTKETIPPEAIEVYKDGKWQPLKSTLSQSDNLIQEAKKYKSAEDFVKAQGTPVYHGTDSPSFNPSEFNIKKATKGETYFNPLGDGLYTSTNKDFVKKFGKNIEEFVVPSNAKVKKIGIDSWQKDFPVISRNSLKNLGIKYDDLTLDEKVEINRLVPNSPIESSNGFEVILGDITNRLNKKGSVQDAIQKAVMQKYKDYDVLRYLDTDYAFDADEIVVKNPAILKTKSQLEEIWKKANK